MNFTSVHFLKNLQREEKGENEDKAREKTGERRKICAFSLSPMQCFIFVLLKSLSLSFEVYAHLASELMASAMQYQMSPSSCSMGSVNSECYIDKH